MRISVALMVRVSVDAEDTDGEYVEDAAVDAAVEQFKEEYGIDVNPRDLIVIENYED